jgi:cysteine desulfuration protein SufE
MGINKRKTQVLERFQKIADWEDRYKELINLGKELAPFPQDKREDKFKVKGCQSQVWLAPEFRDGKIYFHADSDAVLVKGIVALLVYVFSGSTPQEVVNEKADFLKTIGITEHLSMNRANGLASMLKQIHMYGLVYQSLGAQS